ncbi:hypothetical protein C0416_03920 [bacterium]|nr:hypothetical protein [bacterium]
MSKNNKKLKEIIKLKKAWLVFWQFHGQEEKKLLMRHGINKKYLNILSVRKDFDYIIQYAEDLYQLFLMSFSEKACFANYKNGYKNKAAYFGKSIPIFTHHKSDVYKNLMKSEGFDSETTKMYREKWRKYPQYVIVGHNPSIEIHKVFDLVVYEDEEGNEITEWNFLSTNGELERKSCKNGW